jgi:GTPase SAR1 family protein
MGCAMKRPDTELDRPIRVVVVGSPESGKSLLINRLYESSSAQPLASKMLSGERSITEHNWDSRRPDEARDAEHRLRQADVVLVAVDLSQPPASLPNIERYTDEKAKVILVGTKSDDANAKKHPEYAVAMEEMAKAGGYLFVSSSAKTGVGVDSLLERALNPSIVEETHAAIKDKQAGGMLAKSKFGSAEVTLTNIKVNANAAIKTVFFPTHSDTDKSTQIHTKWVGGKLQVGHAGRGEKEGLPIKILPGEGNSISMKVENFPVKDAGEYRKLFIEQVANVANRVNSGVTVTIKKDNSGTLKPALEEKLTRPFEPTPEKKAVITIHGMEPFLKEFEKKGTAISAFAASFAYSPTDHKPKDGVPLTTPESVVNSSGTHMHVSDTSQTMTTHLVDSNTNLTIKITDPNNSGERDVELVNSKLDGKSLKELVVIVKDALTRCQSVAGHVGNVESKDENTGEAVKSDPMRGITLDTGKSNAAVKGAIDTALNRAGFGAQLQPKEEQRQTISAASSIRK